MADITVLDTDVDEGSNAETARVEAGETMAAGTVLWINTSTGAGHPSDGGDLTKPPAGITVNQGNTGQEVKYQYGGEIELGDAGAPLTIGMLYVASAANNGKIAPITDIVATEVYYILGWARTTKILVMNLVKPTVARSA